MRALSLQLTLCLSFILLASAIPKAPFSGSDAAHVESFLSSLPFSDDVAQLHHTVGALARLNSKYTHQQKACETFKRTLEGSSLPAIYHAAAGGQVAKCGLTLPSALKAVLQAALNSGDVLDAGLAAHIIVLLNKGSTNGFNFQNAVNTALSLQLDTTGAFRQFKLQTSTPSVFTSALVYELLAVAHPIVDDATKAKIKTAVSKFDKFLNLGGNNRDVVGFPGDATNSGIATTAVVLRALFQLSELFPDKVDLSQKLASQLATFFTDARFARSAEDVYYTLTALHTLADNAQAVPLVVSLKKNSVHVTNVLGAPVKSSVKLTQAVNAVTYKVVAENVALESTSEGVFSLNNLQQSGAYELQLTAEPIVSGKSTVMRSAKVVRRYVVAPKTQLQGKELEISVSASETPAKSAEAVKVTFPATGRAVSAEAGQFIHVKFSLAGDSKLSQVFIVLTHSTSGHQATFSPKSSNGQYTHTFSVSSGEFVDAMAGAGEYSLEIIAGDANAANALTWKAASVNLVIPDSSSVIKAAARTKRVQDSRKEIQHTFGAPAKRPLALFSLIFTVVVLLPFGAWLVALGRIGLDLQLPSGLGGLYNVIFQGLLAAMLGLIVVYWLALNIFQALAAGAVLGLPAIFFGHRALRASAEEAEGKAIKQD